MDGPLSRTKYSVAYFETPLPVILYYYSSKNRDTYFSCYRVFTVPLLTL